MARRDASGAEKGLQELNSTTTSLVAALGGSYTSDAANARSGLRAWHANVNVLVATTLANFLSARMFGTLNLPATLPVISALIPIYVPSGSGALLGNVNFVAFCIESGTTGTAATGIYGRITFNASATAYTLSIESSITGGTALATYPDLPCDKYNMVAITSNLNAVGNESVDIQVNGAGSVTASADVGVLNFGMIHVGILGINSVLNVGANLDVYFDDIIVDDADAFIDAASFLIFHDPDATTFGWAGYPGALVTAYWNDEDDATGGQSATNAQTVDVDVSNIPGGTFPASGVSIIAVYGSSRDGKPAVTDLAGDYQFIYRESATNGTATVVTTTDSTTLTLRRSVHVRDVKPTGGAWTVAALNGLQLRLVSALGALEKVRVSELWAYSEVSIKIAVSDNVPLTDALTSINVDVAIANSIALAEALAIKAALSLNDGSLLAEALSVVNRFSLADAIPLTEALAVRATIALADGSPLTEALSIEVIADLTDAIGLGEALAITVKVNLTDDGPLVDSVLRVIYVPQGTGGGGSAAEPEAYP